MHILIRGGLVGTLILGGCGGAGGELVRPKDFTASGATGTLVSCGDKPKATSPLVVDLDSDTRVYLESALRKKSVTVVAYDCKSLKVLRNCSVPSSPYDYEGISRKEDVLQLKSQDDLSVNLPLSSGKLGGEMSGGRTLDLALVRVGLQSTTVRQVERASLEGECEGATHFLSTVTVGAFSMGTGSVGKVSAAGELFKIGASGKSTSSRDVALQDGSLESCRSSSVDDTKPPAECRTALRAELVPILGEGAAKPAQKKEAKAEKSEDGEAKKGAPAEAIENPCPEGYQFSGEVCSKVPTAAHLCAKTDEADCKEQCDKGDAGSCLNLGVLMERKEGVAKNVHIDLYKKACDLGLADGCGYAAFELGPYEVKKSTLGRFKDALKYAKLGCDGGDSSSCFQQGQLLDSDTDPVIPDVKDLPGSLRAFERACRLGEAMGCTEAADRYARGLGVAKDPPRGFALLERACASNIAESCMTMAGVLAKGQYGMTADPQRAFEIALKTCKKDAAECDDAWDFGVIAKQSDEVLFELASRHCNSPASGNGGSGEHTEGCMKVANALAEGKGTTKDPAKAKEIYTAICTAHEYRDACTAAKGAKPAKTSAKPKTPPKTTTKKK